MSITGDQIDSLRSAETISMYFLSARLTGKDCVSDIRLCKPADPELIIPVRWSFTNHMQDRFGGINEPYSCSYLFMFAQNRNHLQTAFSLLKAGDELVLEWVAQGGKPIHGAAQSYIDGATTTVDVYRNETLYLDLLYLWVFCGGNKKMSFYLAHSVCPANSARMIKMEGPAG